MPPLQPPMIEIVSQNNHHVSSLLQIVLKDPNDGVIDLSGFKSRTIECENILEMTPPKHPTLLKNFISPPLTIVKLN